jgi:hypothetical protein
VVISRERGYRVGSGTGDVVATGAALAGGDGTAFVLAAPDEAAAPWGGEGVAHATEKCVTSNAAHAPERRARR